MKRAYIGIDPGMEGAIAINYVGMIDVFPIPILDKKPDALKIIDRLPFPGTEEEIFACIESVWRPVSLVYHAGILEGILMSSLDISVGRVSPYAWRKEILGNKLATKRDAVNFCKTEFPDIPLLRTLKSRVEDHNMAEALCIAEYARRKHSVL